jgi:serine protease inhibitor
MLFLITLILFLPHGLKTESIDSSQRKLSLVNNDFAFNIFKLLSTNNKNEVISPISLFSAFGKKSKNI